MASSCPISLQFKLEDKKIPFADDAEEYCDGSISSVGTGSVLGHSSSEDDMLQSKEVNHLPKHWQYLENSSSEMFLGDQHSLNNMLDSVSTQVQSVDIDSISLENSCMKDSPSTDELSTTSTSLKKESSVSSEIVTEGKRNVETSYSSPKPVRPTSLYLQKDVKNLQSFATLTSAYETLSEQLNDSGLYDSIYSGGYGSPTSTKSSGISTSNPSIAHHYISSFRASMRGSPAPADRDPVTRFQNSLRSRYQQLADDRPAISWCPDFQPAVRQMIFSLARDSSWEKGGQMPKMGPSLRRIPLHAILAEERRATGAKLSSGQRVLVMGESGYGKTTLILRLLYDWSAQESAGYLGHWKFVFFVPCRDYAVQRNIFGVGKEELDLAATVVTEMETQTLFLLDGLDEAAEWPNEIVDLLEGKLYPSSTVLATSRPIPAVVGHPAFNKRVVIHGLELRHVETFIRSYFGASTGGCEAMISLVHANARLMKLASNPLMCILLCLAFEEGKGRLPDSAADLFALLMRFVMARSLKQSQGNMTTQQRKILLDFGRLSLQGIKANRYTYTDAEIKNACQNADVVKWGFLLRGQMFNKGQKRSFYQPMHAAWSEYCAALYLASVSHYANILQREVFSLPLDAEPCLLTSAGIHRSALQVLFFLCSILSKKSYLFFNILSSFDFPARTLLSFLQTAGLSNVNVAAICKLIQGHVTLSTSAALELPSWSALLEHPNCQLQSLTVQYDSKDNLHVSQLIDALNRNASLVSLKMTAVIGQGLEAYRVIELSDHLRSIMAKPKLQTLELSVSSVDEGFQGPDVFQSLVDSVCESLASTSISKLALDIDLSSTQVLELCTAVSCSNVQVLHLLHLSVEWSGFQALAALVSKRHMTGLDLSGCWTGSLTTPESKSPNGTGHYVSASPTPLRNGHSTNPMITVTAADGKSTPVGSPIIGTLSGASVTSSSTSTPVSSARASVYLATPSTPQKDDEDDERNKQFLSLPRRTRGARGYSSLNRGLTATSYLSRTDEKRRSDSMLFQKVLLPLPACDRSSHTHSGFHAIFDALRNPSCGLTQLNLSKCSLSVADSMCLGESIRKNRTLVSLRLEGLSGIKEVLPVVLALAENTTLQLLDVSSNHVLVNDSAFQLLCRALGRNSSLQSLRLCSWTFCLEEDDTFKSLGDAVQTTRLRELALTGCLVRIPFQDKRSRLSSALLGPIVVDDLVSLMSKEGLQIRSDWLAFLKLDNCRLEFNNKLTLRGAHLLAFTVGFQRLNELNLALDPAYAGESLRDKGTVAFFTTLAGHCAQLRTLVLHHWRFHWNKPDKVLKAVAKTLKGLSLSCVSLDGTVVHADNSSTKETSLALVFISVLNNLSTLSLNYWKFREEDAADLGKSIQSKLTGNSLELTLKNVPPQTIRSIIRVAEESGKILATYSAGNVYRFKKTGKAPSFLDKMMCITMWKE